MPLPERGFTLAELLIALALLGIIAAFTIPKVLQSSASQEATAKIRETVSTLEQAWYNLRMTNAVQPGLDLYDNIAPTLNTVASGNTSGSAAGGPYPPALNHPCTLGGITDVGWVQFANGVVVSGLGAGSVLDLLPFNDPAHDRTKNYVICIDYNGAASPNLGGQDIFIGNFNQFGGFILSGSGPTTENASMKSFRWGNISAAGDGNVLTPAGPIVFNAGGLNGNFNNNPPHVVGARLVN